MIREKARFLPSIAYPIVDIRDLSELHVQVMTNPEVGGRHLIIT